MKKRLLTLSFVALAGCATIPTQDAPREGLVGMNQAAYVDGPIVTPLELVEDSRCPMNARCIRAGRVVVRARVTGGNWERVLELELGEAQPVADGALKLVSVLPGRMTNDEVAPSDYRFAFEFQGGF